MTEQGGNSNFDDIVAGLGDLTPGTEALNDALQVEKIRPELATLPETFALEGFGYPIKTYKFEKDHQSTPTDVDGKVLRGYMLPYQDNPPDNTTYFVTFNNGHIFFIQPSHKERGSYTAYDRFTKAVSPDAKHSGTTDQIENHFTSYRDAIHAIRPGDESFMPHVHELATWLTKKRKGQKDILKAGEILMDRRPPVGKIEEIGPDDPHPRR